MHFFSALWLAAECAAQAVYIHVCTDCADHTTQRECKREANEQRDCPASRAGPLHPCIPSDGLFASCCSSVLAAQALRVWIIMSTANEVLCVGGCSCTEIGAKQAIVVYKDTSSGVLATQSGAAVQVTIYDQASFAVGAVKLAASNYEHNY
jgi:hypothetical protein